MAALTTVTDGLVFPRLLQFKLRILSIAMYSV